MGKIYEDSTVRRRPAAGADDEQGVYFIIGCADRGVLICPE